MKIPRELVLQKIQEMPEPKYKMIFGDFTAENLKRISEKNGLNNEQFLNMQDIAQYAMLGFIFPSDLIKTLQNELSINQETAASLNKDLLSLIMSISPPIVTAIYPAASEQQPLTQTPQPAQATKDEEIPFIKTRTIQSEQFVKKLDPAVLSHQTQMRQLFEKIINNPEPENIIHLHTGPHTQSKEKIIRETKTPQDQIQPVRSAPQENAYVSFQAAKPPSNPKPAAPQINPLKDLKPPFISTTKSQSALKDIGIKSAPEAQKKSQFITIPDSAKKPETTLPQTEPVKPQTAKQATWQQEYENNLSVWLQSKQKPAQTQKNPSDQELTNKQKNAAVQPKENISRPDIKKNQLSPQNNGALNEIYWKPPESLKRKTETADQAKEEKNEEFTFLVNKEMPAPKKPEVENKPDVFGAGNVIDLSQK